MNTNANDSHGKTVFGALLMGIICTLCIYTYSTNNLDVLGLSPESQKARTLEIIVLLLGQTFLSFVIGRLYITNTAWAYKLGFILVILFIVDFASSYQARNAINQHQTLTKSATEEHAKLIAAQIGVSQSTAKELTDSAQRQRDNKLITGGANTAQKAAKQSDSAVELIKLHGETIKQIKPTEADTFGAWTGNVIFFAMLGLYLLNDAMWAFIGHFMASNQTARAPLPTPAPLPPVEQPAPAPVQTPAPSDSVSPTPAQHSDSVTPAPTSSLFNLEKAREAVRRKNEIARMPRVMPWQFAVPAVVATAATPLAATAAIPPAPTPAPSDSVSSTPVQHSDSVTQTTNKTPKKKERKVAEKPAMQFDTATSGPASHRYQRIRQMVEDKKIKPYVTHVANIEGEQLNTYRAKKYLQAMVNDGLLYWDADKERFRLIETDPRQIALGGL